MLRRLIGELLAVALLVGATFYAAPAQALPSERGWHADVRHAMRGSLAYLDRRVERGGGKLAVNLDIDNTALATHYAPGQPVRPVLRFTERARRQGVAVLFNTARLRGHRLVHARHLLRAAGYRVTEMCGRRQDERPAHSKRRCRRHFVSEGYTLIANIGNRRTDFVGGHYERAFRLPNYHGRLG